MTLKWWPYYIHARHATTHPLEGVCRIKSKGLSQAMHDFLDSICLWPMCWKSTANNGKTLQCLADFTAKAAHRTACRGWQCTLRESPTTWMHTFCWYDICFTVSVCLQHCLLKKTAAASVHLIKPTSHRTAWFMLPFLWTCSGLLETSTTSASNWLVRQIIWNKPDWHCLRSQQEQLPPDISITAWVVTATYSKIL